MKTCIDCRRAKPLGDFYGHPTSKDGRQARCKPCDNQKRMGNYLRGKGGGVDVERRPDGSLVMHRRAR